ncbi:MAG: carboxypeptidase regulatory-like domain-containing protein [Bryobacteraceae bacterium]|nr:carboxypeptidase regulatory-like domain-containing protein [Bryobacteraceae bacterium]
MVTSEDGKPLPGAVVLYRSIPRLEIMGGRAQPAAGEPVVDGLTASDAAGGFTVPDLPAGHYIVCAEVPLAAYLNPCKWSATPSLTLSSDAVGRPAIVLKKGVFLRVHVNDPVGLLPMLDLGTMSRRNLIVGVRFGKGAFLGARETNTDKTGFDYEMVIPAGEPLSLWVFSRHVTLTDSKGSAVDNSGAMIPFQAVAGQDQSFTLNVTGHVPGVQ